MGGEGKRRLSRRRFLRRLAGGGAGLALFPAVDPSALEAAAPVETLPSLPDPGKGSHRRDGRDSVNGSDDGGRPAGEAVDEGYWEQVRARFPLRPGRTPMNAANLCPAPRSVVEQAVEAMRDVEGDVSFHNRAKYGELLEETRRGIAGYLGASPDEVALVRNTTEGNNIVIGGLELGPGDEVLVFDENHPTNNVAWDVRASRFGYRVRRVSAPEDPEGPGEVLSAFRDALSPRTRVLAFSDISNVTGLRLPVRELCRACRERGIHAHVDGAQSFGFVDLDLGELGCDSYATSAHKWFMGPKEAGVLFVRRERVGEVWPGIVGVGWGSGAETTARGARKFETLGQRNDATLAALETTLEFHRRIGPARIEARVQELADRLKAGLGTIDGLRFATPRGRELSGGVVVAEVEGVDGRALYERLYREHGIAGAPTGGFRLCPHVYNTAEDVDRAVEAAVAEVRRLRRG